MNLDSAKGFVNSLKPKFNKLAHGSQQPKQLAQAGVSFVKKLLGKNDTASGTHAEMMAGDTTSLLMPCVWEKSELEDGDTVHINSYHWTFMGVPSGEWSKPIEHSQNSPKPTDVFVVVKVDWAGGNYTCPVLPLAPWPTVEGLIARFGSTSVSAAGKGSEAKYIALRAPNGKLLVADPDATVSAKAEAGSNIPQEAVFKITRENWGFSFYSMSNQRYLRAWDDGTLRLHMEEVTSWEQFRVRSVKMVPKFFGPNLGGWLVTEGWMCPKEVYDGTEKVKVDGTTFQLQSYASGKWASAEGGGGDTIHVDRDSPSSWETFYTRRTTTGGIQIRAGSGHYFTWDTNTLEVLANKEFAGEKETFGLRVKVGDESKIQLKASNGAWLRVGDGNSFYADVKDDAPGWDTNCTLTVQAGSNIGGEFQLNAALGFDEAKRRLQRHRNEWVSEEDIKFIAETGATAVRIPLGYWIAEDPTLGPFVPGTLAHLDKAFKWSEKYKLRILLCLHAAPGSQNGWEHSAAQDGIPEWGKAGTGNVERSLKVIEFLVTRYCKSPSLVGIEAINEPTTTGAPMDILSKYYEDSYQLVRKHCPAAYFVIDPRIYANEREWDNFMTGPDHTNVIFDTHWYQVHDHNMFDGKSLDFNLNYPTQERIKQLALIERGTRLVIVGEWSLALLCENNDDIYTKFGKAQVDTYSQASAGWFFWSYKHGQGWTPWDYKACVDKGWLKPEWWGGSFLRQLSTGTAGSSDRSEL